MNYFLNKLFFFIIFIFLNNTNFADEFGFEQDSYSKQKEIAEILRQIPDDERSKIKSLFEHLFRFNELGFSLFGDKPASFCTFTITNLSIYSKCHHICDYVERILKIDKVYALDWKAWKKYSNLFDISHYILVEDLGVLLVNKGALKKTIAEHLNLFQKTLGKDFNADDFIQNIENGKGIFKLLSHNHELLGIILGFGKRNSSLFQRREDILSVLQPYKIPSDLKNSIAPSIEYSTIEEELNDLVIKLESPKADAYFPLIDCNKVTFAGDSNHIENQELRKKYEDQRKKLKEIYNQSNWFEQTLLQLTHSSILK